MNDDGGYILAMMGMLMIPLVVMAAFAVDLGAWYASASKLQRTADAASLAGVVYLPNQGSAEAAAQAVLTANGYTGPVSYAYPNNNQMQVRLQQAGRQYLSKIVFNGITLKRDATAEFNKPVPLGSPANSFGNVPGSVAAGIWGAINGPYTGHNQGDAFTTKCLGTTSGGSTTYTPTSTCDNLSNPNGAQNPDYKPDGYLYAVDVPASRIGSPMTVQVFDPIGKSGGPASDQVTGTFTTEFQLFDSDGSDVTVSLAQPFNNVNCTGGGPGRLEVASNVADDSPYRTWYTLCTFTPTKSGIHPLRVKSSNIPGVTDNGAGVNDFSLRATFASSGAQATVYALNDMSIYSPSANAPTESGNTISRFYLANIGAEHAGKTLVVDLFDPGDGSCNSPCTGFTLQFRGPPGGAPNAVPGDSGASTACNYNSTPSSTIGPATPSTSSTCTITTKNPGGGGGIYDNAYLRVRIQLPTTYNCTTDCWWSVKYNYSTGSSTDRTVWRIQVIGDPVHLVD
jgi:hypothetical protein